MKKNMIFVIAMFIVLIILSGCNQSTPASKSNVQEPTIIEDTLLLYIANDDNEYLGDLYLKKGSGEKERLSNDVRKYNLRFLASKDVVVFLDKENNLYFKENGKEKELISADATSNYEILGDETGVVFLSGKTNDLYIKIWGQEKEKIASDVIFYDFTSDGKTIGFIDEANNLYVKKDGAEKEKLNSNATYFGLSDDGNIFYFFNREYDFYIRDLSKSDNDKITTGVIDNVQISRDGKIITYLNEYNYEKDKGELYLLKLGESPKKVASDVTDYQLCNDSEMIYYLNEEKNLFSVVIDKEEKNKVAGEIVNFSVPSLGDIVVYENTDETIYIHTYGSEREKIGDDIKEWRFIDNNIVYLTKDKNLYIKEFGKEKEKIAIDIENYTVSEFKKTLSYYTTGFELYIKTFGSDSKKIVDNMNDFSDIWFSNRLLFEKKLSIKDIQGNWHGFDDGEELFIEFTNQDIFKIYYGSELLGEAKVTMENATLTAGDIVLEENNGDYDIFDDSSYLFVKYNNEKEIVIDDVVFKKIGKEEFDNKIAYQKKILEEQIALENKIREAYDLAYEILYTYQVIGVEGANFRESPSIDARSLGTINKFSEFYIDDTFVDDNGLVWCYIGAYDQNGYYTTGWTAYSNFK